MIIRFTRSGGFAGMSREIRLDTGDLPGDEGTRIEGLVRNGGFFGLPATTPRPKKGADYFIYRITVEDGARRHTVETDQRSVPGDLRPLVQELSKRLKP
jgi:hypothetical protein